MPGAHPTHGLLLLSPLLLALACGDATEGDGFDPTADYPSEAGLYLLQGAREPDPPRKGLNTLMLTLKDAEGAPVNDAEIEVEPWMPAHGHGTTAVSPDALGDGEYATERLYFNMAGNWEIRVRVDGPDGADRVVLNFTVR